MTKVKKRYGWVILGLVLLFVPNVNVVDFLPDFIAYFIFAGVLSYGVNKVPYFEEARSSFIKLGIVNLMRVPAMLLMNFIRMENQADTDIFAMMTLLFGVIETIYLIPAIINLFDALFYLGERTEADSTIKPIYLFGIMKVETSTVKEFACFFAVARAVLALLPELCLMSMTAENGTNLVLHPYAHLYPIVFILCYSLSLVIGAVWLLFTVKYISKIGNSGDYYYAIDSLVTEERRPEIEKKLKLRRIYSALNTVTVASIFTLEINFTNFGNVNVLPHFIFAFILIAGLFKLVGKTKLTAISAALGGAYTAVSLVCHGMLISFLESWSYTEIKIIDAAREAYAPIVILSAIELILALAIIALTVVIMREFMINNTKTHPSDEKYGFPDRDFHRSLFGKSIIYAVAGALVMLSKFILILLNGDSDYLYAGSASGGITTIVTTALPWFGTFITISVLVFVGASIYYFGILKDEVSMKYQ